MMKSNFLALVLVSILSACSSGYPKYDPSAAPNSPTPADAIPPKPVPAPPSPPKKIETSYRCKVSNGAGRVFYAIDAASSSAEYKARQECKIYSRNCILLGCDLTIDDDD